ncbi:type VII secretion protein EccB [Streptomyces sp. NPDC000410]|uniref:type VII secretion protein EccB n=1 Tax=Streptomyces sp. NPDC000410 TaxID=3154254 RepID=UPI003328B6BA
MQTRRDQLQAHLTVVSRMNAAMLAGEPDALETPLRRFRASAATGIVLGILVVVAFGVIGIFKPGGAKTWQSPGVLIAEKESTARYIYTDGMLRPVLNVTSAHLLGVGSKVVSVSANSLKGVPHGLPVGIPGAPDALPGDRTLSSSTWLVCATSVVNASGSPQSTVSVTVNSDIPAAASPGDTHAVLVATPGGATYLLWRGRSHPVPDASSLIALGYGGARPLPVADRWVNALQAGSALRAPTIAGVGSPGPALDGHPTRIGQVFSVAAPGADATHLVLYKDGLHRVPKTIADLLLASPAIQSAYAGQPVALIPLSATGAAALPVLEASYSDIPASPPPLLRHGDGETLVPCSRKEMGATASPSEQVVLVRAADVTARGIAAAQPGSNRTADQISVRAGTGLLASATSVPGGRGGALYLITDAGIKYPLPALDVAAKLGVRNGKSAAVPVLVPALTLEYLPTGPLLDPAAASATQPVSGSSRQR